MANTDTKMEEGSSEDTIILVDEHADLPGAGHTAPSSLLQMDIAPFDFTQQNAIAKQEWIDAQPPASPTSTIAATAGSPTPERIRRGAGKKKGCLSKRKDPDDHEHRAKRARGPTLDPERASRSVRFADAVVDMPIRTRSLADVAVTANNPIASRPLVGRSGETVAQRGYGDDSRGSDSHANKKRKTNPSSSSSSARPFSSRNSDPATRGDAYRSQRAAPREWNAAADRDERFGKEKPLVVRSKESVPLYTCCACGVRGVWLQKGGGAARVCSSCAHAMCHNCVVGVRAGEARREAERSAERMKWQAEQKKEVQTKKKSKEAKKKPAVSPSVPDFFDAAFGDRL